MKRISKIWLVAMIVVVIGFGGLFAACARDGDKKVPVSKDNTATAFTVDVWNGAPDHTVALTIADYIDENGAEDVKYAAKSADTTVATASINGGVLTITGKKEGGPVKVTLSAMQDSVSVVDIEFQITVKDTSPTQYAVSGLGDVEDTLDRLMYTVTGNANALEETAYTVTVTLSQNYANAGDLQLSYKVNGGTAKSVTGVASTTIPGRFTFTIAATEFAAPEAAGNTLELVGIDPANLRERVFTVSGLGEVKDTDEVVMYTVGGDAGAFENTAYTASVTLSEFYINVGDLALPYQVNGGTAKSVTGVADAENANRFTFTVAEAEFASPLSAGNTLVLGAIDSNSLRERVVYTVSGIANASQYRMEAEASTPEAMAYSFELYLNDGYIGNSDEAGVSVAYTVGTGEAKTVRGNKGDGNMYVFTIPAAEITGNITLGAVTGIVAIVTHEVTGLGAKTGYTVSGEARALDSVVYNFYVTLDITQKIGEKLEATYKVGEGEALTIEGTLKDAFKREYEFTVYPSKVKGAIDIQSVTGFSADTAAYQTVAIDVDSNSKDYRIVAVEKAYTAEDYTFSVLIPTYYGDTTAPDAAYTVGTGEAAPLTNGEPTQYENKNLYNAYTYTVPKEALTGAVTIDVSLELREITTVANRDAFYSTSGWGQIARKENQPDPTEPETGVFKFTDTVVMKDIGSPRLISSDGEQNDWAQYSFMVKSDGVFDFILFATSNTRANTAGTGWGNGDNWLRLYSDMDGGLHITTCQATVNLDSGAVSGPLGSARNAFTVGEWVRIDLIYLHLVDGNDATSGEAAEQNPGRSEIRLFVNGVWVELEPGVRQSWGRVDQGNLNINVRRPNYGGRAAVWARGGEGGSIYFKKVEVAAAE